MTRELQRANVIERVEWVDAEWRGFYTRGLHAGALAAASWLSARCLCAKAGGWEVSISLASMTGDARFHVTITSSEWGFYVSLGDRRSWIRVTDQPVAYHGHDDF